MDYDNLQGFGLDGPLMDERNYLFSSASAHGLFQHPDYDPPFPPILWSTPDPTILEMNELAWLNRVKVPPTGNILGVDTSRNLIHQRPNIVLPNSQFNIPADMMTAAISSDSLPFDIDIATHAQCMRMCTLSSDDYLYDAMPQLILDSMAPRPCMYSACSEGPIEAGLFGRSCLVDSSFDEINWRNSDMLQGNLGGSFIGFPIDALPDSSSSVAADVDTLDSSHDSLSSFVSMQGPTVEFVECTPLGPVSCMTPSTVESSNGSAAVGVLNQHIPNLDPFGTSLITHTSGVPPEKRQRASYTSENSSTMPPRKPTIYKRQRASNTLENSSTIPPTKLVIPLPSKSISTRSAGPHYPMTSLNTSNALYKDFRGPRRQTLSLNKPDTFEAVGGFATKRDHLDNDPKSLRKQNATSVEPQSVAARQRRKKISERVRILERLIPGGNKMDTASMLDESIEYVKFLQLQVQLMESLGDISDGSSVASTPTPSKEILGGEKDGLDTGANGFGSQASNSCTKMQQVRPGASPLILSDVLQRQLFKQKLCLVSLRQCPSPTSCTTSGA